MRTIGRHWRQPRGDRPVVCGYCGVPWPVSVMFRDRAGHWVCPDDADGEDVVTLAEQNAVDARRPVGGQLFRATGSVEES